MRQPSWWALVGVGTALAGGLGWAVAQGPADAPSLPRLDVVPLPAPVAAKPVKALSADARAEIERLREVTRRLSAAAAACRAEKPKWEDRRRVQQLALDAEHDAVKAAEAAVAAAGGPLPPGLVKLELPPAVPAPRSEEKLNLAKAKLEATTAARDRQARLRDHILQRIQFLDQMAHGCEHQKAMVRDRIARIYFDELDEDGPGYDKKPISPPPVPALPAGPEWENHARPWPPVEPAGTR